MEYAGNPQHKRSPGNFGLVSTVGPRPDATLCDEAGIRDQEVARRYLLAGIERGLVSETMGAGGVFPQNVWAVTDDGVPLEAQLENPAQGTYHGYPLLAADPLREMVIRWWNKDGE